jgi:hypothetical protein
VRLELGYEHMPLVMVLSARLFAPRSVSLLTFTKGVRLFFKTEISIGSTNLYLLASPQIALFDSMYALISSCVGLCFRCLAISISLATMSQAPKNRTLGLGRHIVERPCLPHGICDNATHALRMSREVRHHPSVCEPHA